MTRESDSESETELVPLQPPLPQKSTMLDFFKRKDDKSTTADKKRKKGVEEESKVVTNGVDHHKSLPPAKRRIAENDDNDDEGQPVATEAAGVGGGNKNGVRISNFFRPISKTEFIKESEKEALPPLTMTVKAIVHSPSQEEIRSSGRSEKGGNDSLQQKPKPLRPTRISKGRSGKKSKYVRRSEETDVIQILGYEEIENVDVVNNEATIVIGQEESGIAPIISTKHMFKSKPKKTTIVGQDDEDTVDVDFPASMSIKESSPVKVSLFKNRQTTTKAVTKKQQARKKRDKRELHYDSDSIDIDVLATFSAKTFAQSTGLSPPLDSSSMDSNNAFSVLMKKPLLKSAKDELASSPSNQSQVFCAGDTEVEGGMEEENNGDHDHQLPMEEETPSPTLDVEIKTPVSSNTMDHDVKSSRRAANISSTKVNAFSRLMAPKRKNKAGEEESQEDIVLECGNDDDSRVDVGSSGSKDAVSVMPKNDNDTSCAIGINSLTTTEPEEKTVVAVEERDKALPRCRNTRRRRSSAASCNERKRRKRQIMAEALNSSANDFADANEVSKLDGADANGRRKSERIRRNLEVKMKAEAAVEDSEEEEEESCKKKTQKRRGVEQSSGRDDEITIEKVVEKTKKPIAPIFAKRPKKAEAAAAVMEEDPAKVAARKAFLLSSVPDALKSQVDRHRRCLQDSGSDENGGSLTPFASTIGHVTQMGPKELSFSLEGKWLEVRREFDDQDFFFSCTMATSMAGYHGKLPLSVAKALNKGPDDGPMTGGHCLSPMEQKTPARLAAPQIYSHFLSVVRQGEKGSRAPLTRIFRRYLERKIEADTLEEEARTKNVSLNEIEEERNKGGARRRLRLRNRQEEKKKRKKSSAAAASKAICVSRLNSKVEAGVKYDPQLASSMQWTMKYAPQCAEDIIGNTDAVRDLASWLGQWEVRDLKRRNRSSSSSDEDSDDVLSVFSSSEEDDDEDLPNTALLVGPNGVGKTATVYALAHEMGFKVLEVNASATRNGRQVLANLREATQSHDVRKQQQTSTSKQEQRTALILFEDIDLTFEEADEGFYAAVNSLITSTKRPILLTTSNPAFLPMQMAAGKAKVLKILPQAFHFKPIEAIEAASYLQLLALVEGYAVDIASLRALSVAHRGNMASSMLALQYYITGFRGRTRTEAKTSSIAAAADIMDKAENAAIIKLMALDEKAAEKVTAAAAGQEEVLLWSSPDFSQHLLDIDPRCCTMALPSFVFEWHRFHVLPEWLGCKVRPQLLPEDDMHPAHPEQEEEQKKVESSSTKCSSSLLGDEEVEAKRKAKRAMKFLSESMEAASRFYGDPVLHREIMALLHTCIDHHASSEMDKLTSNTNEAAEDLIMAAVARDSLEEDVQRRQRLNMRHLAHEEAMHTVSTFPMPSSHSSRENKHRATVAFMDILPTVRVMARSEEARRRSQRTTTSSSSSKRSQRSGGRFIHYFDSVNICLTEERLGTLREEQPFLSYI